MSKYITFYGWCSLFHHLKNWRCMALQVFNFSIETYDYTTKPWVEIQLQILSIGFRLEVHPYGGADEPCRLRLIGDDE